MRFYNNPVLVRKSPLITTGLLEYANIGQLWRMWTTRTAEGQSVSSWLSVFLALVLWWNFYRVVTPEQTLARRMAVVGILLNSCVCLTVIYFRYII